MLHMQEKVVEFSKMSPEELLINTERAIGDAALFNMHNSLINGGKDLKDKQTDLCAPSRLHSWHLLVLVRVLVCTPSIQSATTENVLLETMAFETNDHHGIAPVQLRLKPLKKRWKDRWSQWQRQQCITVSEPQ
jgi:hypothetical protein